MKRLIMVLLFGAFIFAGAAPAVAASPARVALEKIITDILGTLSRPDFKNPEKHDALLHEVEAKVRTIFDFNEFSARTVGGRWREFSPEQQKRFTDAFAELLYSSYIGKLEEYTGQSVSYVGEISSTKGDKVEVQTTIPYQNQSIPINYRMLDKDGKWVVYDVIIERVSLVQNYRGQFQEILLKDTPDQLIEALRQKADEQKLNSGANAKK